jgi:hypothetical protein
MAASTVAYSDTRGNRDYTSIIASQIGRRLKEASDMASEERAFAAKKAEEGGTSLEEAGIGKGYFFGRALGSRFGGDRIARTRGRMGASGPGTNPATNYKQRFRGGFDYNVTNQVSNMTDTAPISNAVVQGLSGVEYGLTRVSSAIQRQGQELGKLSKATADMAKATMFNGYLFAMFNEQQRRKAGRSSLAREEASIERGGAGGGAGGGRGMINVTPPGGGGSGFSGGRNNALQRLDTLQTFTKGATNVKGMKQVGNVVKSARSAVNISKIADNASSLMKVPGTVLRTGFRNFAGFTPLKSLKALRDSISAQSAMGWLGFKNSPKDQLANFFKNSPNDPLAFKGNIVDDVITQGFKDYKFDEIIKNAGMDPKAFKEAFSQVEFENIATPNYRPDTIIDTQRFSKNPNIIEDILSKPFRKITKAFSPTTAEVLAPHRIAAMDNAGYKTAEIVGDQLVKKGLKQGLTKGSKLTRMMIKQFGKAGTRSILKQIPIVAGAAGIIFGIQRALEGDFLGAALEITSGLLGATGTTPGLGLMIDGYLLGRDLGMMPGMRRGGKLGNFPANSFLSVNGMPVAKMNEAGGGGSSEQIEVKPNDPKQYLKEGKGIVQAMYDEKQKFSVAMGLGVEKGFLSATSDGGFLGAIAEGLSDLLPWNWRRNNNNNDNKEELEKKGITGDKNMFGLGYRDGRVGYENQGWDFLNMIPDNWLNRKKDFKSESGAAWKKRRNDDSVNLTPEQVYDDSHLLDNGQPNAMGTQIGDFVGEGLVDLGPVPIIINQNIYNQGSGESSSMSEEFYGSSSGNSHAADFFRAYEIGSKV